MTSAAPRTRRTAARPSGVTALVALYTLQALISILTGAIALEVLALLGAFGVILGLLVGSLLILIGLVQLLIAWGLWRGRGWARVAAIIFTVLGLIPDVVGAVALNPLSLIGIVIGVLILWYLFRPEVRAFYA